MLTISEIKAKLYKPKTKEYYFKKIDKNTIELTIYSTKTALEMDIARLYKYPQYTISERTEYYPYRSIYIIEKNKWNFAFILTKNF